VDGFWTRARGRLTYSNVAATLALCFALGGGAYAASGGIPDSKGVFHGCVNNKTGGLRVTSSGASCHKAHKRGGKRVGGEKAISWNEKGVRGETGPQGLTGPAGSPAGSIVQGGTDLALTTAPSSENAFAPSGFQNQENPWFEPTPNVPVVLRDLTARIGSPPGVGKSRTVQLVNPTGTFLQCTIAGTATTCNSGSDQSPVMAPGTEFRVSIFTSSSVPSPASSAEWSFRVLTP
jgi:hypothetical protein